MVKLELDGRCYDISSENAVDISIPLRFNGPQPNAYGAAPATGAACRSGDLIGDTRQGGSCNFETYTLIPHCNGTHTECVGHITHERISVRDCLQDALMFADLVSVVPELEAEGDLVITDGLLSAAVVGEKGAERPRALIVRTLPNDETKLSRIYDATCIPPYFSGEAMKWIVSCGYDHLLVDMPSIDRLFDEGKLLNHRLFWVVEPGSFEPGPSTRMNATITELIYVPANISDGKYLLNLQIAPFETDAASSRPLIWPIES